MDASADATSGARRLHFPEPLETLFREDYYSRSLGICRAALAASLFVIMQGAAFARIFWKGVRTRNNRSSRGLVFVTTDRQELITISGTDAEPHAQSTLPMCEAAALTFHKRL